MFNQWKGNEKKPVSIISVVQRKKEVYSLQQVWTRLNEQTQKNNKKARVWLSQGEFTMLHKLVIFK